MDAKALTIALLAVAVALVVPATASEADPGEIPEVTHYCYGETAVLDYPLGDGARITWDVTLVYQSGATESYQMTGDEIRIPLDSPQMVDQVYVTQTAEVNGDTDTEDMVIKAMHLKYDGSDEDGVYTVRFINEGSVISTRTFDNTSVVRADEPFVHLPFTPYNDGMRFVGWFHQGDDGREVLFEDGDEMVPVTEDRDYYARWVPVGSGGGTQTVVVNQTSTVTFQSQAGLNADVLTNSEGDVTFVVTVSEGYVFVDGSVRVEADGVPLGPADGVYRLDDVDGDVTVTVTGDRLYSVDYRLSEGVSVTVSGYDAPPSQVAGGPLSMTVSGDGLEVTVLMDGVDVTGSCVHGTSVDIADVTGNVVVLVESASGDGAGFPWWMLAVIIVLAVALLVLGVMYRRKSAEGGN